MAALNLDQQKELSLAEIRELKVENSSLIAEVEKLQPGLMQQNAVGLLKRRLDTVTEFMVEVLGNMGVRNVDVALAIAWESSYNEFLRDFLKAVSEASEELKSHERKSKLLEGVGSVDASKLVRQAR